MKGVLVLCEGNPPVNSHHKLRKALRYYDVIKEDGVDTANFTSSPTFRSLSTKLHGQGGLNKVIKGHAYMIAGINTSPDVVFITPVAIFYDDWPPYWQYIGGGLATVSVHTQVTASDCCNKLYNLWRTLQVRSLWWLHKRLLSQTENSYAIGEVGYYIWWRAVIKDDTNAQHSDRFYGLRRPTPHTSCGRGPARNSPSTQNSRDHDDLQRISQL